MENLIKVTTLLVKTITFYIAIKILIIIFTLLETLIKLMTV
jgi:hypothetical protein